MSRIVATIWLVAPWVGLAQNATLITTFTNPAPADIKWFGWSVAAVGDDRVVIGAPNDYPGSPSAGTAYLFTANGALLTTFSNPTAADTDAFGFSVAAVGSDRVLVGAYREDTGAMDAGAAYLFSTNGTLLTTFTNPAPADFDFFGYSVAALGGDRVLIGANRDDTGAMDAGAVYLFSSDGTLLTTFTNPTPAVFDGFGSSVAAVGGDHVLIGDYLDDTGATDSGAAYLFNTNGALLTTFTNPAPAHGDLFGYPVAALGSDRLLIGAFQDDTDVIEAGAAYLFSTDGALLTTFTNPAPARDDFFGVSVAPVENDCVLIGAYRYHTEEGVAYLFSTNGMLLITFTNPTPADGDLFGCSLVAVGSDRVLIGAYGDDTEGEEAGAAYLFLIPPAGAPSLNIRLTTTNTVAVSWPSPSTGFTLQQNTNGIATANWSNVTDTIQDDGTNRTLVVNPPAGNRFYRLLKP